MVDSAGRVIVVGAGLAGLAAAVRLARAGVPVTVVERRRRSGGRTTSFLDPATGEEIDNGQHVFLGCCTAYRKFLGGIGIDEGADNESVFLQRRFRAVLLSRRRRRVKLAAWPGRAEPGLAWSMLRYGPIPLGERFRTLLLFDRIAGMTDAAVRDLDDVPFGMWLADRGVGDQAQRLFWEPVLISTLNTPVRETSTALALFVFRKGILESADAARIGYARVPLGKIAERAVAAIRAAGGEVRFGAGVRSLRRNGASVAGVDLVDGASIDARAVILAVPFGDALGLLPPEAESTRSAASALRPSPIVNVHVTLDREVTEEDCVGLLDSPVHWVFNRRRIGAQPRGGDRLVLVRSAADPWMRLPKRRIAEIAVAELKHFFPPAREAEIRAVRVVREPAATFRALPGVQSLRPPMETGVPGLLLAGDWVRSDWPATMETAVRSGTTAADRAARFDMHVHAG